MVVALKRLQNTKPGQVGLRQPLGAGGTVSDRIRPSEPPDGSAEGLSSAMMEAWIRDSVPPPGSQSPGSRPLEYGELEEPAPAANPADPSLRSEAGAATGVRRRLFTPIPLSGPASDASPAPRRPGAPLLRLVLAALCGIALGAAMAYPSKLGLPTDLATQLKSGLRGALQQATRVAEDAQRSLLGD